MSHHMGLIRLAHDDARHILATDPDLLLPRGRALRLLLALFEFDAAMGQLKVV
jgi:ATP-dependent DNA helicase RecG